MPELVKLILVCVNPAPRSNAELLLTRGSGVEWGFPSKELERTDTATCALSILDDLLFQSQEAGYTTYQTGLTSNDLVKIGPPESAVYSILLRRDRMPLRYSEITSHGDREAIWSDLQHLPTMSQVDKDLYKAAIGQLQNIDKFSERTVNAARTVHVFAEYFGHSSDPIRRPKAADKRSVSWVYDEIKAGVLRKEAVMEALEFLSKDLVNGEGPDALNHLYRIAWRNLATSCHEEKEASENQEQYSSSVLKEPQE